jgi:predicted transcriptional regulator
MARPRGRKSGVRLSVSFDERTHGILSEVAREHDATIAWVVRRAVADFVGRQAIGAEPELPLHRAGATDRAIP